MDKAVAVVRAVNLSRFRVESWQQVALDLDKHADALDAELGDDIDARPLSEILKLVLQPPPKPEKKIVKKIPTSTTKKGSWAAQEVQPPSAPTIDEKEEVPMPTKDRIPKASLGPWMSVYGCVWVYGNWCARVCMHVYMYVYVYVYVYLCRLYHQLLEN